MSKFYFSDYKDNCYELDYHLEYMRESGINEMKVFEAKVERGADWFYCLAMSTAAEKNDYCGKGCPYYHPRNHISGICEQYGYVYDRTEKSIVLTINKN